MALKFLQSLGADDIFISYARLDASTYAMGLADELTKLGFSCFIDRLGTDPNKDLPETLKRKIRSCSMLVVVGTNRAAERETIEQEIREFLAAGRTSIVPVNFGNSVYGARWYPLVEGIAPEPEPSPTALDDGDPSDSVVSRIKKQFTYRRRDERLRRTTRRAVAVLVLLLVAIAVAAGVAWQQLRVAAAATATAKQETERAAQATYDAHAAQDAARKATEEANAARDEATRQRDVATKQKALADKATQTTTEKTRLANEAARKAQDATARANAEQARAERQAAIADIRARANRSQSYLRQRPEEVGDSLSLALDAMKMAERIGVRNADADTALRESLALFPLRRGRVLLSPTIDGLALSPDGLHYATVDKKVLRVYATGEKDADNVAPLLERSCDCAAIALASELKRAAAILEDERGFKIFDLKDDARSRVIESVKGARGEKITSAVKLALSPDGRYLALYVHEGEEDSEGQHSKLLVLDAESGEPIKIYDDDAADPVSAKDIAFGPTGSLNMLIRDVAFGPTGDLAIVGKRIGVPEGRAVIWRLNTNAPSRLTSNSFTDYEVVPQAMDVRVIAPGADATYFATDKGVWKRPAWQTRFDLTARLPSPAGGLIFSVKRISFRPGGRSLVLARVIVDKLDDEVGARWIVEVWDAAGHKSQAEALHTAEVIHVGFEPGGRLVATMTEHDSKNITDEPPGENHAHRMRVYQTGTGVEVAVAGPEPSPEDPSASYVGPDAVQIVTLSGKTVKVWDVWAKDEATRERAASFGGVLDRLESVALGSGGRFLALLGPSGGEKRVVVYRSDGDAYTEVKRCGLGRIESSSYGRMALSADGRRLVVIYESDKNPIRVYDDGVENTALRQRLGGLSWYMSKIALSANGRYLAVAGGVDLVAFRKTGRARLFDIAEGSWETMIDGEFITSIAFSPDGAYVGVGSDEGVLHIFETAKSKDAGNAVKSATRELKEEIARLQHTGPVTAVAFSDDGRYVATASRHPQPYLVEEEERYPLRVWVLRPADLIAESERRLGQQVIQKDLIKAFADLIGAN